MPKRLALSKIELRIDQNTENEEEKNTDTEKDIQR